MTTPESAGHLKKDLRLLGVYAFATGATLSAGFFLLPGLAAQQVGPGIVLAYLIAAVPLIPAMLCIVELATAMPRAGGAYYFLDRSLGPLVGVIGGFGTWLALTLKAAFALVGMGAYVELYFSNVPIEIIGLGFAVLFGVINLIGSKESSGFQIAIVSVLLFLVIGFIGDGLLDIEPSHFEGFFEAGAHGIVGTAGMVYISYVGVTKVASLSEEIEDPERNLPRGVFLSLITAVVVYGVGTTVMVGVVPPDQLRGVDGVGDKTLVATTAEIIFGDTGKILVTIAAMLAFASVANAGILSSSRYPLAMARDNLLPRRLQFLGKRGTPALSIMLTVAAIVAFLFVLDPIRIAKLASAFQLLIFALLCLSVIVMRESKIESYDPGYRSPFYPWLQLFGVFAPMWLIAEMGWLSIAFTTGVIAVGIAWFYLYAEKRVARYGAIYHVFERLGQRRFDPLDSELRGILKEKGLRAEDPFDEVVASADVFDVEGEVHFEEIARRAAQLHGRRFGVMSEPLLDGFMQGTRTGATPVSGGVALPHLRLPDIDMPHMVVARTREGVRIEAGDVFGATHQEAGVVAVFFLISPDSDPGQHLRLLAQLAGRVDQIGFREQWLAARGVHQLKETLLRNERFITLYLDPDTRAEMLIGVAIRELDIPQNCLVVLVSRGVHPVVPRGDTMLARGDRVTIIGDPEGITKLHEQYDPAPPETTS
jgi:APA family basic amino acid/polyamine antiporter